MNDNPYQSPLAEELDCSLSDSLQFLFGITLLIMNIIASSTMLYFGIMGIMDRVLWMALFYTPYGVCELALCVVFVRFDPCMHRHLWLKCFPRSRPPVQWEAVPVRSATQPDSASGHH